MSGTATPRWTSVLVVLAHTSLPYTRDRIRGIQNRQNADTTDELHVRLLQRPEVPLSNPSSAGRTGFSSNLRRNHTV